MDRVLQFSGGKDSLACLWKLREEWEDLLVLWVDTGDGHPGRVEEMEDVAAMVPHFLRVAGDQPKFIREVGWPVDVLPERLSQFGHMTQGPGGIMLARAHDCCMANIWKPLHDATKLVGAKVVYRGTRLEDKRKTIITDGQVIDGIEYRYPVRDWTTAEVLAYLGDKVPKYYREGEQTSRDCMHCTAYLDENVERIKRLPPESKEMVMFVLRTQRMALQAGINELNEVLDG